MPFHTETMPGQLWQFAVAQPRQSLPRPEKEFVPWLWRSFNTRVVPYARSEDTAGSLSSFLKPKQMHKVATLPVLDMDSPQHTPTSVKIPFHIESPRASSDVSLSPYADRQLWPQHGELHASDVRSSLLHEVEMENSMPSSSSAVVTPRQSTNPWRNFFKSRNDKFLPEGVGLDEEKCRERARASMNNDVSSVAKAKLQMVRDARRQNEKEAKLREKANREAGEKLQKLEAEVRAKVEYSGTSGTELMDLKKAKKKARSGKIKGYTQL